MTLRNSFYTVVVAAFLGSIALSDRCLADTDEKDKGAEQEQPHRKKGLIDELSGQGYGTAGCGLGSILFGQAPGLVQVFAVSTNNIYSNNTFAASSGTSNCDDSNDDPHAAREFVSTHRVAMEDDVARGQGETLNAFFDLTGCPREDAARSRLSHRLQERWSHIFKPESSTTSIYSEIRQVLDRPVSGSDRCTGLG